MVKTDVVNFIYEKTGCPRKLATLSVEQMLSIIKETLAGGENVQIVGFGRFHIREKRERMGRDPSTGGEITIAARKVLTFRPSRHLKEIISGPNLHEKHGS